MEVDLTILEYHLVVSDSARQRATGDLEVEDEVDCLRARHEQAETTSG